MKKRIQPSLVTAAHSYTRSDEPWLLEPNTEAEGSTATGKNYGWKLFHYISGCGTGMLGRTPAQDVRARRQSRFLVVVGALALAWFCLLVF